MKAGERFVLADHQTVANYTELTTTDLLRRALELPGGELVTRDRETLIDFITKTELERRKANSAKEADRGADEFLPEAEAGDE
jgi:hypothetical protein